MKIDTISAVELDLYINKKDIIIVDVRNEKEYKEKHICGAINFPLEFIEQFYGAKEALIILYCERGAASLIAASKLQRKGYNVKSVVGGISSYKGRFLCKD